MPISDVEKIVRHEPLEDFYEVGKELGRGKFAIVKRCTEKATGMQYAAKILKKRRRGKTVREDILMEIDIMRQGMNHKRIIKLYEVFESQTEFYIIIELALGGELFRVIAVEPLEEAKARDVVFQILEGVQHLHTLNIVHMDLKPENLLLYLKGSLEIRIVDFGLAVQLQEGQELKSLVGTAEYVSPEILSFEALSTYSDMWSIGALTYALLTGYSPFQGETHQETFLNVSTCDYDFEDELFDVVSSEAKDFIEKLLIRTPRKRLTAEKCLQHPWIKAHKSICPDGSTGSPDSALCMDSASSMEPSPVSSASSSFSPAPSATSHSGGSGTVVATTTATATTSSTAGANVVSTTATAATSHSTPSSLFSRPEDMKKVNEKLGQISKLATEQLVADTATKPRPEGSPTSTTSSTSTLKGDEVNEPLLVESTHKEPKPLDTADGGDPESVAAARAKSATLGRGSSPSKREEEREQRRTTSFENTQRRSSPRPLDRNHDVTSQRRTTSFENAQRQSSPRPLDRNHDVTSLDPKTLESMERFQRLKERSKTRESESYVRPLLRARSPEPSTRRKSDGVHLSSTQRRLNSRSAEETKTSEETRGSASPEDDKTPCNTSPHTPSPREKRKFCSSTPEPAAEPTRKGRTQENVGTKSPNLEPQSTTGVDTKTKKLQREPENTASTDSRQSKDAAAEKSGGGEESNTPNEPPKPVPVEDELEKLRKERERVREERRRARAEAERKREEERKKLQGEAQRKMEEEQKRFEEEREARRRERERKLSQRSSSSSSGSSDSLMRGLDRSKWAWSVEARATDSASHRNGVKPHSPRTATSDSEVGSTTTESADGEAKTKQGLVRKVSLEITNREAAQNTGRKKSSEFFQFGLDYSSPRNSVKRKESSEKSPEFKRTASPQQQTKSPPAQIKIEVTPTTTETVKKENAQRPSSPAVVISPSPPPEPRENRTPTPTRAHRDRSPAAEHTRLKKSDRRKTPVISTDALDKILRGEVDEADLDVLQYATDPNPYHKSQLESCPEVEEPSESSHHAQRKSPSTLVKTASPAPANGRRFLAERREAMLPSALKDPNRPVSPEKRRVTLLETKGWTQSADFDHVLSPENSELSASQTPSSSSDAFTKSFDASCVHSAPKPEAVSRLTVSGNYSSLSRSTPDLSEILGGASKKTKESRKVERSNSRIGRSRIDSYVTSTEHSSSYYRSPASPHIRSSRHATMTSRRLSGGRGFLSKLSNSTKNNRHNRVLS